VPRCGGGGGGAPLTRRGAGQVRLQTQEPDPKTGKMPYAGMVDCARQTFSSEGARGLYKGAASPLVGAAVHNAGVFFTYGQAKKVTGADARGAPLWSVWLAGAIAAVPITFIEAPVGASAAVRAAQAARH